MIEKKRLCFAATLLAFAFVGLPDSYAQYCPAGASCGDYISNVNVG